MQGQTNEQPDDSLLTYTKSLISNCKSAQDFLDINTISLPKTKKDVVERMQHNFDAFKGNYIIVGSFFTFVFLVFNPSCLPLIFIWCLFFAIFKSKENISYKGINFKKELTWKICAVFSVLYVCFIYYVIFALLATISFFVLMVLLHMNLFYEKEEENEV
ncbi:hypothetical protein GVAV_000941 [Gurleya vavrai]